MLNLTELKRASILYKNFIYEPGMAEKPSLLDKSECGWSIDDKNLLHYIDGDSYMTLSVDSLIRTDIGLLAEFDNTLYIFNNTNETDMPTLEEFIRNKLGVINV